MEDTAQTWTDDEVDFGEREAPNKNWNGYLKSDGTPVRKCDGGHWKLLEEFPPKSVHFATWDCYYCHDIPKPPPKKAKKAAKFSQYNEYVMKCIEFKDEFRRLRSEYQAELGRLKTEEKVIRAEFHKRKDDLFERQKEHEQVYREKISTKI